MKRFDIITTASREERIRWLVFGLCVFAFLLRVYVRYGPAEYLFYGTSSSGRPESDAVTWFLHTLNMLEGRGFGESVRQFYTRNFVPPGHPFLLGAIQLAVGNDPARIGWVVALLSSLLPLPTFLWVREMWGARIGLWAAFLAAIHAPFMHISFSLMSEPMAILSASVALYFGARAIRRQRLQDVVLAGLAFGLAALVRPAVLAFLWGSIGILFCLPRVPWRRKVVLAVLWLGVTLLPQAGWQYRNYRVHGEWSSVYSSISARHAWTGVHPEYMPYFYSRAAWHETMWRDPYATEMASIKRMQHEAKEWIIADPLRYAMSCVWRMKHLVPELNWSLFKIRISQGGWGRFYFMFFFCLAPLGAFLAMRTRTRTPCTADEKAIPGSCWALGLLSGMVVGVVGAGVYGASARYRWPLEYAGIPFLALLLDRCMHINRVPLFASGTYEVCVPRLSRAVRAMLGVLLLAGTGYLAVYVGVLVVRHRRPPAAETQAVHIDMEQIEQELHTLGLWQEWTQQNPRRIAYQSVFAEQARQYGDVVAAKDKLVVWWGFLRLPIVDENGYHSGYIVLEPEPDPLGKARLDLQRHPAVGSLAGNWIDGQVVTVIARLSFRKAAVARPKLLVYQMLPGRLPPNQD